MASLDLVEMPNNVITKKELEILQIKNEIDRLTEKNMEIENESDEMEELISLIIISAKQLKILKSELAKLTNCQNCGEILKANVCITKNCFAEWLKTTNFNVNNIDYFLQGYIRFHINELEYSCVYNDEDCIEKDMCYNCIIDDENEQSDSHSFYFEFEEIIKYIHEL